MSAPAPSASSPASRVVHRPDADPAARRCPRWVTRLAGLLRGRFWSAVLTTLGCPVAVTGGRPRGACVIVANHSSHADTPAMLAALRGSGAPVVAAAADYWFAAPLRRMVCRTLIGGFPVRRGHGGSADLARAATRLRAGRSVLVFAEGTRSRDGALGRFHSGAFRLAADAGVPVVPAAIVGTHRMLAVHGRLDPGALEVRFGTPLDDVDPDADPDRARAQVAALLDRGAPTLRVSPVWRRMSRLAASRTGLLWLAAWGFLEALVWPLMAEFTLVCLAGAARARRVPALAVALAAGSVGGIACHMLLVRHGVLLPAPWTTDRMRTSVAHDIAARGPWALLSQPTDGIPVKVYARAFGQAGTSVWQVAAVAALTRTARMLAVGAVTALVARLLRRILPSCYGVALAFFATAFFIGLRLVIASWR